VVGAKLLYNALMHPHPRVSFNIHALIAVLIIIVILAKTKAASGVKVVNADSQPILPDVLLNTLANLIAKDTQIAVLAI